MKKYGILLIFIATIFMGIGYASVNSVTLNTTGRVSVKTEKGIIITNVVYDATNSTVPEENGNINFTSMAMMNSVIDLGNNANARLSYDITIYNSTAYNYVFDQSAFDTTGLFYDNQNIIFEITGLEEDETVIKSKHSLTFKITFKYANGFTPSSSDPMDNILNSYINFVFQKEKLAWYKECRSASSSLKCKLITATTPSSDSAINFNANASNTNGLGLYYTSNLNKTEDIDGDDEGERVYYYRGLVTNNFLIFDSYCWRIVRINEDETIRIIYAGTPTNGQCPNNASTNVYTSNSRYNQTANNNAYVGYMYGSTNANNYTAAHTNTNNSTIKTNLDNWYTTNLSDSAQYIADSTFCADRGLISGNGYGTSASYYGPGNRFVTNNNNQSPTYKCAQSTDAFTVDNARGNKALTYPIGLLTADEANYAGIRYLTGNTNNRNTYLYSGNNYWLMSPSNYGNNAANMLYVYSNGNMRTQSVASNTTTYIRPVINLISNVAYESGNGTYNNPYVVNGIQDPDEPIEEPVESENWYENCTLAAYEDRLNCKVATDTSVASDSGINFGAMSSNTNGNGVYYVSDTTKTNEGKRVYYYRGAVTNNYVTLGGLCFRIVRTNEDESIRLVYGGALNNGSCPQTGSRVNIGTSSFNTRANDNAYVGYMYGTTGSNNYNATHTNTNNSTIKEVIDTWYQNNLASSSSFLADSYFCNDRSMYSGNGYGTNLTSYNGYNRLFTNKTPTLVCSQANDRFSVSSNNGNGALTYPVGLLTADEVQFAGSMQNSNNGNTTYYLYTANAMWTMTPSDYYSNNNTASGYVFYINTNGQMRLTNDLTTSYDVRPVINVKKNVEVSSGNGAYNSPYTLTLN